MCGRSSDLRRRLVFAGEDDEGGFVLKGEERKAFSFFSFSRSYFFGKRKSE